MFDTNSKPEKKQNAYNVKDTEITPKTEGQILEQNVKFLLTHFEEFNEKLLNYSNYKIKEVMSLLISIVFLININKYNK